MRTPTLSTHSGKLERWLGKEQVEHISNSMKGWYGRPIAMAGVPGAVYVGRDGDFVGRIRAGLEVGVLDVVESFGRRMKIGLQGAARGQLSQLNTGFSGIGDLVTAATTAKRRKFPYYKVGASASATSQTSTLWQSGNYPAPGGAASAAPAGRVTDYTTTGAFTFGNPSGQTQHFAGWYGAATIVNASLLLYDRLFDVAKTMNSTATEAVSGVPTRYTNVTAGTIDSAENNFLFIESQVALAATAHNWTVCQYTNQAGTTTQTLPSVTGNSGNQLQRLDQPIGQWFAPLAAGDSGISALTQMQCSALVATGSINFVIGHPIAWMAHPVLNTICVYDGVSSAFNLERIFDSASLAFLEPVRSTTTASTYAGTFVTLSN